MAIAWTVGAAKVAELQRLMARVGLVEADLVEKFVRSSGPGGQKINKTSSAVYLRHVPSGEDVKVQVSRTQALNRYYARKILAERLEAVQLGRASEAQARREKIRRQKRRRSRRSKAHSVADKRIAGRKKRDRQPSTDDS